MTLRAKIGLELGILAGLTVTFLVSFPLRSPPVDFGLAALALVAIGLTARYTKERIWGSVPINSHDRPARRCWRTAALLTGSVVLLFLVAGCCIGFAKNGWAGVSARILNPGILLAFALYVPWALAQQTLFQFYLLGRLVVLFPAVRPLFLAAVCGVAYSLVHLPDLATTAVTAVAGVVWSLLYFRYRLLLPLALSHAALGSTFYYWVCGQNLAAGWNVMMPGLPGQ